jgi:hypothetical protein
MYLSLLQYRELKGFITNTNNLYSINNGPFPNTALIISAYLLNKIRQDKNSNQNDSITITI